MGVILVSMTVKEGTFYIPVVTFMFSLIYPLISSFFSLPFFVLSSFILGDACCFMSSIFSS